MVVTSRKNPAVLTYRQLCRDKRARDESGEFCAEGMRLCLEALDSGAPITSALISESARKKYPDAAAKISEACAVTVISDDIAEYISDTKTPQGFFMTVKRLDKSFDLRKIVNGKYILLDGLQDSGNVGTIIRTCEALGVSGVILSPDCADIYSPKTVRSAMGSLFRLPVYRCELTETISAMRNAGVKVYAAVLNDSAEKAGEADLTGSCAAVIGNEGSGVSGAVIKLCTGGIYIPIERAESLNASVAAAIICWEMTGRGQYASVPEIERS